MTASKRRPTGKAAMGIALPCYIILPYPDAHPDTGAGWQREISGLQAFDGIYENPSKRKKTRQTLRYETSSAWAGSPIRSISTTPGSG